mmetsp:Transcript_67248/g.112847  ORF Transcript_67248/g.112847 Transcript_67248/m.112847 type:complete len:85 (-) Transcript_67248:313-567(-)
MLHLACHTAPVRLTKHFRKSEQNNNKHILLLLRFGDAEDRITSGKRRVCPWSVAMGKLQQCPYLSNCCAHKLPAIPRIPFSAFG